jgi:hypothetical protein
MVTTLTRAEPTDRCDRCTVAAAQVRAELDAGVFFFCDHHARKYGFKLGFTDCLPSQPTPSPRATTLQSE